MRRWLLNLAAAVSLILFIAFGVLWWRGLWHYELANADYTAWPRADRMYSGFAQISWYSHTVGITVITESAGPAHFNDPTATWFTVSTKAQPPGWRWHVAGDRTTIFMQGDPIGFHYRHYGWTPVTGYRRDTFVMGIRPWAAMLALAVMPALWLKRRRALHVARRLGRCPRCGYDLRATPERECRTAVTLPATTGNSSCAVVRRNIASSVRS